MNKQDNEDRRFWLAVCIGFYLISIFFCSQISYGLGRRNQANKPCSKAQCFSERLKGEESCLKKVR